MAAIRYASVAHDAGPGSMIESYLQASHHVGGWSVVVPATDTSDY